MAVLWRPSGSASDPREAPGEFYPYIEQGTWRLFSGANGLRRGDEWSGTARRYSLVRGKFDTITVTPRELALALETPSINAEDVLEAWLERPVGMNYEPRVRFSASVLEAERRMLAERPEISPLALRRTLMTWLEYVHEESDVPDFYRRIGDLSLLDYRLALWCASSLFDQEFFEEVELSGIDGLDTCMFRIQSCAEKVKRWIVVGDEKSRESAIRSIKKNQDILVRLNRFLSDDYFNYMEENELRDNEDYREASAFRSQLSPLNNFLILSEEIILPTYSFLNRSFEEYKADGWREVFARIGDWIKSPQEILDLTLEAIETFPAEPSAAAEERRPR